MSTVTLARPSGLQLQVRPLEARLRVPGGLLVEPAVLQTLVVEAGLRFGLDAGALAQVLVADPADRDLIVARGLPASAAKPDRLIPDGTTLGEGDQRVLVGQRVGMWLAGCPGVPGMEVTGQAIPPSSPLGSQALGPGLELRDDQEVVAVAQGVLVMTPELLWLVVAEDSFAVMRPLSTVSVQVSEDHLSASLDLEPGCYVPIEVLHEAVAAAGIRFGLRAEALRAVIAPSSAPRHVVVAQGELGMPGNDARLEVLIDQARQVQVLDDGTLDFRSAHDFQEVCPGMAVARYHPATTGRTGMDVLGRILEVPPGHDRACQEFLGEGVAPAASDPELILSNLEGVFRCDRHGVISVVPLLVIDGDVDLKVGNIQTTCSVHVRGDIKAGFSVKTSGDLTVDGVIEDARVSAQGVIHAKGGILPGTHRVKAHGELQAAYITDREVKAGDVCVAGSVRFTSILSTGQVEAKEILGGRIIAAANITADVLGSEGMEPTVLEAGVDPFRTALYEAARQRLTTLAIDLEPARQRATALLRQAEDLSRRLRLQAQLHGDPGRLRVLAQEARIAVEEARRGEEAYKALLGERDAAATAVAAHEADPAAASDRTATVTARVQAHPGVSVMLAGRSVLRLEQRLARPRFHLDEEWRVVH